MRENYKPESIKRKSYCEIYENKIAKIMSLEWFLSQSSYKRMISD